MILTLAPDGEGIYWNMRTVQVPRPDAGKMCPKEVHDAIDTWYGGWAVSLSCKTLSW